MKVIYGLLLALCAQLASAANVTANLTANVQSVDKPTSVVLTWSSTGAAKCTAAGGWTGVKALSGTETVQVTKTTGFTLTCESPTGPATLKWTPPTQYNTGAPLTVKSYIMVRGASPAVIDGIPFEMTIPAPASSIVVQAPPGLNYFALRALDADGIQSPNSALVSKQVVPDASAPQVLVNFTLRPEPPTNLTAE